MATEIEIASNLDMEMAKGGVVTPSPYKYAKLFQVFYSQVLCCAVCCVVLLCVLFTAVFQYVVLCHMNAEITL
jgi:hypothetical protein